MTAAQVLNDYNGVSNTTSLLAHYNMINNVKDFATGGGTYDGTIVGGIIYTDANEFASRLSFGCGIPASGDNISIAFDKGMGFSVVVQAA